MKNKKTIHDTSKSFINDNIKQPNNKISNIAIAIIIISAAVFLLIIISIIMRGSTTAISAETRTLSNVLASSGVVIFIIIQFVILLISLYGIRFRSINEEVMYYNEKNSEDKHFVIAILQQTSKDYFVLSYFQKSNEIRPAVFTKRKNKIGLIDLRIETTYYKKIYLDKDVYNENKNIRIRRVKNKFSKTQMIFFASAIDNLEIYIYNKRVPKIDCNNKIGKFSVYGMIENPDEQNIDIVNINGCEHRLVNSINNNIFINRKEIIRSHDKMFSKT